MKFKAHPQRSFLFLQRLVGLNERGRGILLLEIIKQFILSTLRISKVKDVVKREKQNNSCVEM